MRGVNYGVSFNLIRSLVNAGRN